MIGRVVKGKYKIYDEVGTGGFAVVYLGRNLETNEIVAIKVLAEQFARESRYVERFRREAGLAERLRHPNIVRVLDHGVEGKMHYLVMEFVEGLTLDKILLRKGRLPIDEVLSYVEQTCAGLQAAHRAGVVHRDLKPANLMITPEGTVKIMDFGIARMEFMTDLTQSGTFMGTPRYISPEVASGAAADIRSDLYALGLLTYEMLAGAHPFDSDNPWMVLRQQLEAQPVALRGLRPDVPLWLEAIVTKASAKDPDKRFQSPAEMLAAVREGMAVPRKVLDVPPPIQPAGAARGTLTPAAVRPSTPKPTQRRGLILGLVGAVVVVALGLIALLLFGLGDGKATPVPAAQISKEASPSVATAPVITLVVTSTSEEAVPLSSPEPQVTKSSGRETPAATDTPGATAEPMRTDDVRQMATNTPPPSATPTKTPRPSSTPTRTPRPTNTPTATRTPTPEPTKTPTPKSGPSKTPTPGPLASNVRDFGGSQGLNGWKYLMENGRYSGNWREMTFGSFNGKLCWRTDNWEDYVRVCNDGEIHPGMSTRVAYEWRTSQSRAVKVRIHAQKIDTGGDGIKVTVQRVVNRQGSQTLGELRISGGDTSGVTKTYTVNVGPGIFVFVFIDISGNSEHDASRLTIDVY